MDILEHIPTDLYNQIYSYLGKHPIAELFRRETTIDQDYDFGCYGYMLESSEDCGDDIYNSYLYEIDEILGHCLKLKRKKVIENRPSSKISKDIKDKIESYRFKIRYGDIEKYTRFYKYILECNRLRRQPDDEDDDINLY